MRNQVTEWLIKFNRLTEHYFGFSGVYKDPDLGRVIN